MKRYLVKVYDKKGCMNYEYDSEEEAKEWSQWIQKAKDGIVNSNFCSKIIIIDRWEKTKVKLEV